MPKPKILGVPKTIGELRELTKDYPDETLLNFRNEPVHQLEDCDGIVCFSSEPPGPYNPMERILADATYKKPCSHKRQMSVAIARYMCLDCGYEWSR